MPTEAPPPAPTAEWVPSVAPSDPNVPSLPPFVLHVVDGAGDRTLTKDAAMREIYDARQAYHDAGKSPLEADVDLAHLVAAHDAAPVGA